MKKTVLIIAALMAAGLLAYFGKDQYVIYKATEAVKDQLLDSDSAKFSDFLVVERGVCGVVNAKNRMGAFVGKERFMFIDNKLEMMPEKKYGHEELASLKEQLDFLLKMKEVCVEKI